MRTIDLQENFPGTVIELDHAFRVKQHMAVLHRFELQAKAAAQLGDLASKGLVHTIDSAVMRAAPPTRDTPVVGCAMRTN
ncbi:hypothetical protein D3C80_1981610 [compost metagenome]